MKRKGGLQKKILKRLEMAPEAAGSMRFTSIDDSHACVENYKSVVEYTEKRIRLDIGAYLLTIEGEGLELMVIGKENVAVRGRLFSVRYEKT